MQPVPWYLPNTTVKVTTAEASTEVIHTATMEGITGHTKKVTTNNPTVVEGTATVVEVDNSIRTQGTMM